MLRKQNKNSLKQTSLRFWKLWISNTFLGMKFKRRKFRFFNLFSFFWYLYGNFNWINFRMDFMLFKFLESFYQLSSFESFLDLNHFNIFWVIIWKMSKKKYDLIISKVFDYPTEFEIHNLFHKATGAVII